MSRRRIKPQARLIGYKGPYNKEMLENARKELMSVINSRDTSLWNGIKRKIGIYQNGERDISFPGWGQPSCDFSHADLPESTQSHDFVEHSETVTNTRPVNEGTPLSTETSIFNDSASSDCILVDDSGIEGCVSLDSRENDSIISQNSIGKGVPVLSSSRKMEDDVIFIGEDEEGEVEEEEVEEGEIVEDDVDVSSGLSGFKVNVSDGGGKVTETDITNSDFPSTSGHGDDDLGLSKFGNVSSQDVVFKCDFCDNVSDTDKKMKTHLKNSIHYSASTFFTSSDKKLLHIKDRLILKHRDALYKTVLAVCPVEECSRVFPDIHKCALHYWKKHDRQGPSLYGLVKVEDEISLNIPLYPCECTECGVKFLLRKKLFKHLKVANHYPYKEREGYACFFFCKLCERFHFSFASACSHKSTTHDRSDGLLPLVVMYGAKKEVLSMPEISLPKPERTKLKRSTRHKSDVGCKKAKLESNSRTCVTVSVVGDSTDTASAAVTSATATTEGTSDNFFIDRAGTDVDKMATETSIDLTADAEEDESTTAQEANSFEKLTTGYKCDFCDLVSNDEHCLLRHLKTEKHSSASLVLVNSLQKAVNIKAPAIMKGEMTKTSMLAVCRYPGCYEVFADIYVCCEHYIYCHDEAATPGYALAPVVRQKEMEYCWENNSFHLQTKGNDTTLAKPDTETVCFLCVSCKIILGSSAAVSIHMNKNHKPKKPKEGRNLYKFKRKKVQVIVFHINNEFVAYELLPYENNLQGEMACVNRKIDSLEKMRNALPKASEERRELRWTIQNLKTLISRKIVGRVC